MSGLFPSGGQSIGALADWLEGRRNTGWGGGGIPPIYPRPTASLWRDKISPVGRYSSLNEAEASVVWKRALESREEPCALSSSSARPWWRAPFSPSGFGSRHLNFPGPPCAALKLTPASTPRSPTQTLPQARRPWPERLNLPPQSAPGAR